MDGGMCMKKVKGLISRHKVLAIICLITIVIIAILSYVFLSVLINGNNKYGNRLDGIEEIEISDERISGLEEELEGRDEVSSASVRIQGKIIYINIVFNNDVSLDTAKDIANGTLDSFEDDEESFYDFGFYLTQVGSEDEEGDYFVVTGSKHVGADEISYIKS